VFSETLDLSSMPVDEAYTGPRMEGALPKFLSHVPSLASMGRTCLQSCCSNLAGLMAYNGHCTSGASQFSQQAFSWGVLACDNYYA